MRHAMVIALVFIIACSGSGCATVMSSSGEGLDTIKLTLTAAGTLLLDGKAVPPERLPARLKSQGATPDTAISIDIPADTPPVQLTSLTSRLATAGFRKIVFKRPRHAAASVLQPTTPASAGRASFP